MDTRKDNFAESGFRIVALVIAYGLWCTVGLILWVFLATRVSLAYGASLFSGQTPSISQDRLSAALHWWVDGMHRIRRANESADTGVAASPFSFWQECAYSASALLISCLCYVALPTSHAIYDSIRNRLGQALTEQETKQTSQDFKSLTDAQSPERITVEPLPQPLANANGKQAEDFQAKATTAAPQPTDTDISLLSVPIASASGVGSPPIPVDPTDGSEGKAHGDTTKVGKPSKGVVRASDNPSTFTTGIFNGDGIEIATLAQPKNPDAHAESNLYLRPEQWSIKISAPKGWKLGWGILDGHINLPSLPRRETKLQIACDGDIANPIDETALLERNSEAWSKIGASSFMQFRIVGPSPVWFDVTFHPADWEP